MRRVFIIGTGRNGSKLTDRVLSTAVNDSNRFGEIHGGLFPIFFRDAYHGFIPKNDVVARFKQSRDQAMAPLKDFYVEKNHLIVPILNQVKEAYPDALFLYVPRHSKDTVRSFMARNHYSSTDRGNVHADGRLTPSIKDPYHSAWGEFSPFEKICWYVSTMTEMCKKFLDKLPNSDYNILPYETLVKQPSMTEDVFSWLDLNFDLEAIESILNRQWGSSARSPEEVDFKIIDEKKFKRTPHWNKWSEEQNEIYGRFFDG
jgi:hypothetical protein